MSKKTATHSATVCLAVTPSDSTDLTYSTCRAIYVGTGGNISLVDGNGATIVFTGVTAGSILPVQTARVNATGTTATSIIALY
ncbi:hypothetical protein P8625_23 [Verrucomicrobia phage P8625]|uniref:tail fiber protein n=1 Tax=Verrucomicrobia phage P8625 TaxID=1636271 RepID=UPI0005FEB2B1|nr:tail fiber protein [Verrucomicrobia phage P8625]AKA60274.1 hypothetical protein P8625_23 [Verrucomicrobia phage P8625]